MRIFVTGGTGYIGSALVENLVGAGYRVFALVRSADGAETMRHFGAEPVLGDVNHPESYREVAAESDALIHAAAASQGDGIEADRRAVETLLAAAERGNPKQVIFTSGVWVLGSTGATPADESASTERPLQAVAWRPAREQRVLQAANAKFATAVVRPGMVYGEKRGLVSRLFASAVQDGAAEFVGDGENRWSLVHREDLAELYRLLCARGARGLFHAVDGAPVKVADAARAASAAAGKAGAVKGVPLGEARARFGALADALVLDQAVVTSSAGKIGWSPTRPSFVESAHSAYKEWRDGYFETMYGAEQPPPWEIGRPQQTIVELVRAGKMRGNVFDSGCGSGENALHIAAAGHRVTGIDVAATAIRIAQRKASERRLDAHFSVGNALSMENLHGPFPTVIDTGLFHVFDNDDRARYVENLARVVEPGGRLWLLCFSDAEPGDWGPRRIARDEIVKAFARGWKVESIDPSRYENFRNPDGSQAWLAGILRSQ